eukprot:GHVS01033452.1.p1 GENE.GHVS01033452.1~~GHVS01033452.1.p1  ORF type:complete len:113 (+),score=8.03 GHVS01033452.1:90-428(+)
MQTVVSLATTKVKRLRFNHLTIGLLSITNLPCFLLNKKCCCPWTVAWVDHPTFQHLVNLAFHFIISDDNGIILALRGGPSTVNDRTCDLHLFWDLPNNPSTATLSPYFIFSL